MDALAVARQDMAADSAPFNLIHDQWIPVRRRRAGERFWLRPWEITAEPDNPIIAIDSGRPDFDAALTEFMIGLMALDAPENEAEWREGWANPPSPDVLRQRLEKWAPYFNFDGPGPRAFQDWQELDGAPIPAASLLINSPGEQTLKRNTDLFVKRDSDSGLSRATAAWVLIALQTYAPAGGKGNRTSLRGGGPLTTLVVPPDPESAPDKGTFWHTLWVNTPTKAQLNSWSPTMAPVGSPNDAAAIFSWLSPARTSEKSFGCSTTPADVDSRHVFFACPRRIRLDFSPADGEVCALTGRADEVLVRSWRQKNYGVNYRSFVHPFSPHYREKVEDEWRPRHGQPGGVTYRHWLGLVAGEGELGESARVVSHANTRRRHEARLGAQHLRLRIMGYDMDNMKARGWVQSEMPVPPIDDAWRAHVLPMAQSLVDASSIAASSTAFAVKSAWFRRSKDAKGDFSVIGEVLWKETETAFYGFLWRGSQELTSGTLEDVRRERRNALSLGWLAELQRTAFGIFDAHASLDEGLEHLDMQRRVKARYDLVKALKGYGSSGKKLFDALSLETPDTKAKREKATNKKNRTKEPT